MENYAQVGGQLRAFLQAFMGLPSDKPSLMGTSTGPVAAMAARRQNASPVPGSRHYATMLAYGNFILADGGVNIRCEAIQGISGVITLPTVNVLSTGHPEVQLVRFLTHFYFETPSVVIEQNPNKQSTGYLRGASVGDAGALLPGKASFAQYLILSLNGKPLANRDPLVMTAERVTEWPPIGATFVSENPTDFYEMEKLEDSAAKPFATLAACKTTAASELSVPDR